MAEFSKRIRAVREMEEALHFTPTLAAMTNCSTAQRGERETERGERETEAERRISIRISQERTDRPTSCECATATGKGCTIARESLARSHGPAAEGNAPPPPANFFSREADEGGRNVH